MIQTITSWQDFKKYEKLWCVLFQQVQSQLPGQMPKTAEAGLKELTRCMSTYASTAFLSVQGDQLQACAVAMQNEAQGMIGCVDTIDESAGREILKVAADWLSEQGCSSIIGPINGDTWHHYRVNIGPWDEPVFMLETDNPRSYAGLWQAAGFKALSTYHSKLVDDLAGAEQAMSKSKRWAAKQGIVIEDSVGVSLEVILKRIYELTLKSFSQNFLYTPITFDDFCQLYSGIEAVIDHRYVLFAVDAAGQDLGYCFAVPDYHKAIQAMKGKRHLLSKLKFVMNKKAATRLNVKTLGVIPMPRRAAVAMAMMSKVYCLSQEDGYQQAILCLMKDDNASRGLDGNLGRVMRRYELYEK